MDIRPSLQIQVMIKAMEQVVVPAVDPVNKIAHEQASLVLATLRVLEQRMPLWRNYLRDELRRLAALVDEIVSLEDGDCEIRAALAMLAQEGHALFARSDAETPDLEQATIALRNGIGRLMAEYKGLIHRTQLGRLILHASKEQLERERAWLLPFGFESDTSAIVPIEQQLASAA